MKKRIYVIIAMSILVIICTVYCCFNPPFPKVKSFSVAEYTCDLQEFSSDVVFGYTPNAKTARRNAETLWIDVYGPRVKREKPYQIYFDEENDLWLITGTLHGNNAGGYAYAIIRKNDGMVLAVWHEK